MEYLWWFMVFLTMIVYPVMLVRGALKGRPWALETLKAMRYLGGETMAWRALPDQTPPPARRPGRKAPDTAQDVADEPGRLVA